MRTITPSHRVDQVLPSVEFEPRVSASASGFDDAVGRFHPVDGAEFRHSDPARRRREKVEYRFSDEQVRMLCHVEQVSVWASMAAVLWISAAATIAILIMLGVRAGRSIAGLKMSWRS
jgi:hypothetical protein